MAELHLTLLCPPEIEEKVLDLLLLTPEAQLFTSAPTSAHGLGVGEMSTAEQVLGRARMVQVDALLAENHKDALLLAIRREFAGTGLRYWLVPVIERGEIE